MPSSIVSVRKFSSPRIVKLVLFPAPPALVVPIAGNWRNTSTNEKLPWASMSLSVITDIDVATWRMGTGILFDVMTITSSGLVLVSAGWAWIGALAITTATAIKRRVWVKCMVELSRGIFVF